MSAATKGTFCRRILAFVFVLLIANERICLYAQGHSTRSDREALKILQQKWSEQFDAVVNGEFEVEFFQLTAAILAGRTIDQATCEQFLEEAREAWDGRSEAALVREVSLKLPLSVSQQAQSWRSGTICFEGAKVRNKFAADLIPGAIYEELDCCFDGNVDVHFVKESKQVNLTEKGPTWHRFGLTDLWSPGPLEKESDAIEREGNRLVVNSGSGAVFDVDLRQGVLLKRLVVNGRATQEIVQFGFQQYDVGGKSIEFPSVHSTVNYVDGKMTTMLLFVIKSAKFNTTLSSDAFVVPIPTETTAVLYKDPNSAIVSSPEAAALNAPVVMRISEEISDARTLIPILYNRTAQLDTREEPLVPIGRFIRKRKTPILAIILNMICISAVVIWVFTWRGGQR